MEQLETSLTLTKELTLSANLCDHLSPRDLDTIGKWVKAGYDQDDESRSKWKKRYESAMNLAVQLQQEKSFPWQGSSNVKFPLITIAALQWHSRAYPTLISGTNVVKCRVIGPDPKQEKFTKARRIGTYMSWQLLEEDQAWEEGTDRALIQLPIVGCVFKKTRRDSANRRNVSETVSAMDFVIDYYAKSVEEARRKTHVIPLYRNDVYERIQMGSYRDISGEGWYSNTPQPSTPGIASKRDQRIGQTAPQITSNPQNTPFVFLEQHVLLDLDCDGYDEPYIITIESSSACVVRIVAAFEWEDITWVPGSRDGKSNNDPGQVLSVKRQQYFTKYEFIPSPDGSVYGVGFGFLLGPLSDSVDSIINQLIDAGTLSTTAGGFLGRGIKIRGGEYSFRPFGWQRLDSQGEDISKNIFPFPVREPSNVLFQLLGLLIDYTNRISGSTDIMVGENPGQNTPAQTSQLMAEQGAKINSAIFKRVWRCMKNEFDKLFELNRMYLAGRLVYGDDDHQWISAEDFQTPSIDVRPAADPNLTSDTMRMQQAQGVIQRVGGGGYNKDVAERMYLTALKVEDIDNLYPGVEKMPPPKPIQIQTAEIKAQSDQAKTKQRMQEKVTELQAKREQVMADIEFTKAQIAQIISEIGASQASQQVTQFEAQIRAAEAFDKSLLAYMEALNPQNGQSGTNPGAGPGMANAPGNPVAAGGA